MLKLAAAITLALLPTLAWGECAAHPIPVVAAENFYGDVAQQIGGTNVGVTSILANPDQDPHLFEVSPAIGRAVSAASIVVYNGLDYDPWMAKLIGATRAPGRQTIVVADLIGRKAGDNPHLWYDPATLVAYARALSEALATADPAHGSLYKEHLAGFVTSLAPVQSRIALLRRRLAGTPAAATEPVFGAMFAALGMPVRNEPFQRAVMNGTEPSASDIAAFEEDLRSHAVKLLAYNSQASDPVARRMQQVARAAGVPVVGVTETEPPSKTYQTWIMDTLEAVDTALPARP